MAFGGQQKTTTGGCIRDSYNASEEEDKSEIWVVENGAEAFHKFVGQPVKIFCSSRTDAGVHALSNVCHIDVERISKRKPGEVLPPHEPGVVQRAVNHFLQNLSYLHCPKSVCLCLVCSVHYRTSHQNPYGLTIQRNDGDVMVTDVRSVPSNYHARYKARERT
ncbi:hypothetical protein DY000_02057989 [Brassica cretica]|uniref:tRNA pseudouridine synthase n=1 Tax=Brassica cretica TaxID=69181 RepID=A0ABQ7AHZ1_BRACR|nr:hypothetical protein DY000_02057989 [Brassica cretica]